MSARKTIATACGSFAVTNIDNLFVLVTFYAEAAAGRSPMTPIKITLGQYLGFTVIVIISMVGFVVSFVLPYQPIGFLGLLPILLGVWRLPYGILDKRRKEDDEGDDGGSTDANTAENHAENNAGSNAGSNTGNNTGSSEDSSEDSNTDGNASNNTQKCPTAGLKSILKVSAVTIMNGSDNIGTYVPLFAQASKVDVAVYIVVYYIMLGLWCLGAFLVMKQRHLLHVAQKYARLGVPLLYIGLGIYILVHSECYPWSVARIDDASAPGRAILAVATVVLFSSFFGIMAWVKLRQRRARPDSTVEAKSESPDAGLTSLDRGEQREQ